MRLNFFLENFQRHFKTCFILIIIIIIIYLLRVFHISFSWWSLLLLLLFHYYHYYTYCFIRIIIIIIVLIITVSWILLLLYWPICIMVSVFANGPRDQGSIPGRVIPKTKKWYLIPPCLTLQCSSYWKGSLWVTLDYSHQLYYYYYTCLIIIRIV